MTFDFLTDPYITVEPGDKVEIRLLTGEVVRYEITHTIEPGRWGCDPYIPSNIVRGEN